VDVDPSVCWTSGVEVERVPESAHAASSDRLAIGKMLSGRYRVERELGEGGMGLVYVVRDEQVAGETFAVKVLKQGRDPEALNFLREEVRKTRKLSHPNIVDVHSVNVDGTALYVLMEYLEGKSLKELLDEEFGRGMPLSHAWPIIEDVGAALGYAHDHNVIHSDLKPANVLLTTSGRTKLLDFGIARISRGPVLHQRSGQHALTPAYASCEMLKGKEADPRDDIYSFACVIYEMLSGERPFGELNALEARDVGTRVPQLAVLTPAQNEALTQALAFDREARIASVEQLLAGLAPDKGPRGRQNAVLGVAVATVAALALTYLAVDKLWTSDAQQAASHTMAAFAPPPHSVAVLPFVNMSGDKEQEYFSDGLTEELLNSLSRINELQIAARTSSFSFKDKAADLPTIAHKLNVASVLEGSVRRSGNKIRITAQLNNAVTGFHLWSQTYDRDLSDVLQLQTDVANAVATALKVTLLSDVAAKIELGGTHNPSAFDAYVRASRVYWGNAGKQQVQTAIDLYTEAIRLDPSYALAFADRSNAFAFFAGNYVSGRDVQATYDKALADAREALKLAPRLAEAHLALARSLLDGSLDFSQSSVEYDQAVALAPGDARVLRSYSWFAAHMGRSAEGLASARRAVMLDPLNPLTHGNLGTALLFARRYPEAVAALKDGLALNPEHAEIGVFLGLGYYLLGDFESARAACEAHAEYSASGLCLAMTYEKLGRHADAQAALAKLKASRGDAAAYMYVRIYAQSGNMKQALEWLEKALELRDQGLQVLKTDPYVDPLRNEPRFQAIERELKFPD
jgi:serine/threonine-protein kinase